MRSRSLRAGLGSRIWQRIGGPAVGQPPRGRGSRPGKRCSRTRSLPGINCREDKAAPAIHNFLQFLPFHPIFLKNILSSSKTAGLHQFASFQMLMRLPEGPQQTAFPSTVAWPAPAVSPPRSRGGLWRSEVRPRGQQVG